MLCLHFCTCLHLIPLEISIILKNNDEIAFSENGILSISIPCRDQNSVSKNVVVGPSPFFGRRVGYDTNAHFAKRIACRYSSNIFISVPCSPKILHLDLSNIRTLNGSNFKSRSMNLIEN